jgi:hypothetical protein
MNFICYTLVYASTISVVVNVLAGGVCFDISSLVLQRGDLLNINFNLLHDPAADKALN